MALWLPSAKITSGVSANKKILITFPAEKNLNIMLGEYVVMSCPLTSFFASSDLLSSGARRYAGIVVQCNDVVLI